MKLLKVHSLNGCEFYIMLNHIIAFGYATKDGCAWISATGRVDDENSLVIVKESVEEILRQIPEEYEGRRG
jgi:hypothetical protein